MGPELEWSTKLGGQAQNLVSRQGRDNAQPEYRRRHVQEGADDLTVAELRTVSVELSAELERLRVMTETIHATQNALRKVAGV